MLVSCGAEQALNYLSSQIVGTNLASTHGRAGNLAAAQISTSRRPPLCRHYT